MRTTCNLSLLAKLHQFPLKAEHKKLLRQTCFGDFLDVEKFRLKTVMIESLLCHLVRHAGPESAFKFGGTQVMFSAAQVSAICGLPDHGRRLDVNREKLKSDWARKFFPEEKIHRDIILEQLEKQLSEKCSNKDRTKDAVRLYILYILAIAFFPYTNGMCPTAVCDGLQDLSTVNEFN